MPNVYIVNDSGYKDYEPAKEYGDLVFLTGGYVNIHRDYKELLNKVKRLIEKANPDEDHLVLSGNNLLCVLAFYLWYSKFGKVKVLHWNAQGYELYEYPSD